MKIQIIGYSGSGKSTLAKLLADYYHLPLLYLDNTKFYGYWQEYTYTQQNEMVKEFLDQHNHWVIDGNYGKIQPQRFKECDIIIFLNYNRFFCLYSCIKRYFQYKGKKRESCACLEKMDFEFFKWIVYEGRTKQMKQKHLKHLNECQGTKLIFTSRKQLNKYLKSQGIL